MASPQLNNSPLNFWWYSLTYQSNELINDELHNKTKVEITKIIVDGFNINEIHSFIHGHIVFGINTIKPTTILSEIVKALNEPLARYSPPLLFSINLMAKSNPTSGKGIVHAYVNGSDDMENHFKESIKEFFPKKNPAVKK